MPGKEQRVDVTPLFYDPYFSISFLLFSVVGFVYNLFLKGILYVECRCTGEMLPEIESM